MIKTLLLAVSIYLFMHSNLPLMVFDNLNNMDSGSYIKQNELSKFEFKNDFGDTVLDVSSLSPAEQINIWNKSNVKEDFLESFPDFSELRNFVNSRIYGEELRNNILVRISKIEENFISGNIDALSAKESLLKI